MDITGKKVATYVLMPQILPRLQVLFASGFSHISYNMALVYHSVGLLPAGHPYLYAENASRFGMTHVIAEAARNLNFSWKYIDKIVVFFALLLGAVMMCLQLIATGAAVFVQAAHAAMPTSFVGFFATTPPTHDIAFVLLERVFGVPGAATTGFFNTCVSQGIVCFQNIVATDTTTPTDISLYPGGAFPSAFHDALRAVMQYYSIALLVVAVLIFIYFIFAILAETAQTGTPFGRRFNKVFAPLRMVMALGLLIPFANGLNSAQYITLYMAKWGSSFATNGWKIVNTSIAGSGPTSTLLGDTSELVAYPKIPPANSIVEFATTLSACIITSYRNSKDSEKKIVDAYVVKAPDPMAPPGGVRALLLDLTYVQALEFSNFGDIIIRFGEYQTKPYSYPPAAGGTPAYPSQPGHVEPTCGEIILPTTSIDQTSAPGSWMVQEAYYEAIKKLFVESGFSGANNVPPPPCCSPSAPAGWPTPSIITGAALPFGAVACDDILGLPNPTAPVNWNPSATWRFCDVALSMVNNHLTAGSPNTNSTVPDQAALLELLNFYNSVFGTIVTNTSTCGPLSCFPVITSTSLIGAAVIAQGGSTAWAQNLSMLGWAGAAIWYNKVAQLNGSLFNAVYNFPTAHLYPMVMEGIQQRRKEEDQSTSYWKRFEPYVSDEATADTKAVDDLGESKALYEAQSLWQNVYPEAEGNAVKDFIMAVFGLEGLYNLVDNKNNNIHPLAMLAGVGKSLVESSVRNIGYSGAAFSVGGIAHILGKQNVGAAGMTASNAIASIAMIGLAVGFVLFYIIPFMPFIYFFFAVGGWIKGIFEAMVGVPLWALAHIRIDGEGLPGDAAMNGYYLLLEIFLRPILIIFGLIAALQIFAAQVYVLHNIWDIVLYNVAGFSEQSAVANPLSLQYLRGEVDTFFYTILYAIIVYMLGMAAFKLIDLIPNHILRWIGASVQTFGEGASDPADNLVRNTMFGTQHIGGHLSGAMRGAGTAAERTGAFLHPPKGQ